MRTQQQMLDRRGLSVSSKPGKAPRVPPKGLDRTPPPSCAGNSRQSRVMEREARERWKAEEYQLALVYRDEDYRDTGEHFSTRAVKPEPKPVLSRITPKAAKSIADADKRKSRLIKQRVIRRMIERKTEADCGFSPSAAKTHYQRIKQRLSKGD